MQKLTARSGSYAKSESRWNACGSEFIECGDGPGDFCRVAYDVGSRCATPAASGFRVGSGSGSRYATASSAAGQDYCSGRNFSDGDSYGTAECEP